MSYEGLIAETVHMRGHEGDLIDAYLARPLGAGPHGGVVLIHHMPGWDEASKEMARKLAYHGLVTISPNLHLREGKATPEENSASIRERAECLMSAPWPMSMGPWTTCERCRISTARLG